MKKLLILLATLTVVQANNTMQVSDFILDYNSLQNKNVCVSGNIMSMGDDKSVMLMDRQNSMTSIYIDVSNMPRKTRKAIMQQCGMGDTCSNIVCGQARKIMFDKGIYVNQIK